MFEEEIIKKAIDMNYFKPIKLEVIYSGNLFTDFGGIFGDSFLSWLGNN
jgi:hypothetical protein